MTTDGDNKPEEEEAEKKLPLTLRLHPKRVAFEAKNYAFNTAIEIIEWRPPSVAQVKDGWHTFWSNFFSGLRSDHTVVSFIAPAEDDEALSDMQVVQLFWATLILKAVYKKATGQEDLKKEYRN